jgi:hypothetical protein
MRDVGELLAEWLLLLLVRGLDVRQHGNGCLQTSRFVMHT